MLNGIILANSNYTYEGNIVNAEAHGKGTFHFANGDKYIGECKFNKLDGFGKYYYKSGATYEGFFSYGKIHGVGTFEDNHNVYKGTWRNEKKHGVFIKTSKIYFTSQIQRWNKGKIVESYKIQYIQRDALQTTKENPLRRPKQYQISYKGTSRKCMGCCDSAMNATNSGCGHVVMCHDCLGKCERCPICRAPIEKIIRLYVC